MAVINKTMVTYKRVWNLIVSEDKSPSPVIREAWHLACMVAGAASLALMYF